MIGTEKVTFTVGAAALEYPEVQAAIVRLAGETVDRRIAARGFDPVGDCRMTTLSSIENEEPVGLLHRFNMERDYVGPDA